MNRDQQRGELQLPVLHHQVEQGVWLRVKRDPDVLWVGVGEAGEGGRGLLEVCMKLPVKLASCFWYHGLVDMSSTLKLQDAVGISGGGLGVSEGAPSLCRMDLQLDQRGPFLFGPGSDGSMLHQQLTTAAPEGGRSSEDTGERGC